MEAGVILLGSLGIGRLFRVTAAFRLSRGFMGTTWLYRVFIRPI